MSLIERIVTWPKRDYEAWVALGLGGLEHSVAGWLTVTAMRGIAQVGKAFPVLPESDRSSVLADLPQRSGTRPRVAPHPVPQRELGGNCSPEMLRELEDLVFGQLETRQGLKKATSKYEKHVEAIYVQRAKQAGLSRSGEMVHVHRPQGSLHVHLSSADARAVYERGWGEPHGLAFLGVAVPKTYLFLYFPRDHDELRVTERIVAASLDWACRG